MPDARIETFMRDVRTLDSLSANAVRAGAWQALSECQLMFGASELDPRRKIEAEEVCRQACMKRLRDEIAGENGPMQEHLRLVLGAIENLSRYHVKD